MLHRETERFQLRQATLDPLRVGGAQIERGREQQTLRFSRPVFHLGTQPLVHDALVGRMLVNKHHTARILQQ